MTGALSVGEALGVLREGAGSHFDAGLIEVFIELMQSQMGRG